MAKEAEARVETLCTKDGKPARPGQRAYRLQPDGRLVLQSVTLNQQAMMRQEGSAWSTPVSSARANRTRKIVPSVFNGTHGKHLSAEVYAEEGKARPSPASRDWKDSGQEPAAQARKSPCLPTSVVLAGPPAPANDNTTGKSRDSSTTPQGQLNPRWVLQLMGYPSDYLDGIEYKR